MYYSIECKFDYPEAENLLLVSKLFFNFFLEIKIFFSTTKKLALKFPDIQITVLSSFGS